ncbi:MAG TPA: flagellar motor protein [Casimicrobiaceae bacterium]|jgi:chemotaxis protein MotA|nr:flagellar motor protein [Casimicrobiaceae bacterium]
MDILSITGIVVAVGTILAGQLLEGGAVGSLLQVAAFLIVIGGTVGAVMLQSPRATFVQGVKLARWIFAPPPANFQDAIDRTVAWAQVARRDGMLALENELAGVPAGFERNGLQMLVDGFDPERIREALEVEIAAWEERHRAAAKVWESAGGYAPTVGILGAVLGLIHVMENLSDPAKLGSGIAVAFVATVYGVGSANLILLPIGHKLKTLIAREVARRELFVDGLMGIANGENPKLIEARLNGYLA